MGSTDSNGVYTPDLDEEGWDPELATNFDLFSQSITDLGSFKANQSINVKDAPYNAVGDGVANDTAAFTAAIAAAPEGGFVSVPAGTYKATIAVTGKRIGLIGAGASTIIRASSAGPIISISGAGVIAGFYLGHMKVLNDGAGGGVELRRVHHSQFDNVVVTKAGGTAWRLYGCLLNQFNNCVYTVNEAVPASGNAAIGLALDYDATLVSGTNANTFVNFVAEGTTVSPGVGIDLVNCVQNVFLGATSEGNTIGIRFGATAYTNQFFGTWMEANGTDLSGSLGSNSITYQRNVSGNNRERFIWNGDFYLQNGAVPTAVLGVGLAEGTTLAAVVHARTPGDGAILRLDSTGTDNPGLLFEVTGTATTPVASMQSADSSALRELKLNPAGGAVSIGLPAGEILGGVEHVRGVADGALLRLDSDATDNPGMLFEVTGTATTPVASIQAGDTFAYRELKLNPAGGAVLLGGATSGIGFYGATPAAKPTITGDRFGNTALADLLTDLASRGLLTDSTTDSGAGSGAPTTADYLVGTTQAGLSAEIVVGTSPGGELGGTWASPTVDATHSGSAHHAAATEGTGIDISGQVISVDLSEISSGGELGGTMDTPTVDATHSGSTHAATQAAAEATAAAANTADIATHAGLADPHTGYQKESEKAAASGYASLDGSTKVPIAQVPTGTSSSTVALGDAAAALDATHAAAADPHTGYQRESEKAAASGYASLDGSTKVPLAQLPTGTSSSTVALGDAAAGILATHEADTTSIHGITDTAALETTTGSAAKVTTHEAAADPHTGYQRESEKAAASGYASLDGSTKVPIAQIPTGTSSSTVALGDAAAALVATHEADSSAVHAASAISFTPTGTIAATDAQTAIAEVASEGLTQTTFAKQGAVAVTTGTLRWYNYTGRTLTFQAVAASVGTAPTGATLIVDVNKDGTTIFTTQGSRPTIAISGFTDLADAPDVTTIANGSYLTVDVDQVGSTIAGSDLTVQVVMRG